MQATQEIDDFFKEWNIVILFLLIKGKRKLSPSTEGIYVLC